MTESNDTTKKGLLIAFEGIDGTGKTTQIKLLAKALEQRGMTVVQTREPTDGPCGRRIRELFMNRQSISLEEELKLFMDDRRDHVRELIAPSLAEGKVVLTDRYYFSTAAYQGAAGQDPEKILKENERFAPRPDLVIILVVPVAVGVDRVQNGRGETLNDFEQEEMLVKVADIFDSLKGDYLKRVDATGDPDTVHARVMKHVAGLIAAD